MKILKLTLALAFLAASMVPVAEAAAKGKGRDAYTKEQQKKFYEQTLKLCRKEYGDHLHYVKVDYSKGTPRAWCYHY